MATMVAGFRENELVLRRGGEKSTQGGDGMFLNQAKLVALIFDAEALGEGLFIGRQWRLAPARYFSPRASVAQALNLLFPAHMFELLRRWHTVGWSPKKYPRRPCPTCSYRSDSMAGVRTCRRVSWRR